MIKEKIRNEKGISLISLVVTVLILLLLVNIIIYNVKDNLKIGKLKEMQNDIANLRDKVSLYYSQNGKIPASIKYTNIDHMKSAGVISQAVDTGDFLVLELTALENLTLNYGEDFEKVKNSPENANIYKDLYIINEASHNIFYVRGITIGNEIFYTDYTSEKLESKVVDLRYVENVKIPDGFYYVGGTKDTGIVISDIEGDNMKNTKQGNQFVWVPVENFNEFVRQDFGTQNIANVNFIHTERTDGKYYEPIANGIMNQTEVEQMYKSVKNNKGFYIARYEAGTTEASGTGIRGKVVSKKNANVYNQVKWGNSISDENGGAVQIARGMDTQNGYDSVTSTLCYGVQWDAVMRWISKDEILKNYLITTGKGNYGTSSIIATGSNEDYQMKNIYDMAGNVYEWTMEAYSMNSQISRGGSYNSGNSDSLVTYRYERSLDNTSESLGFRVALYLNEEEKWSPIYDEEGTYKDKNGNTAYIPQGFQVSEKQGENTINEGLVVKDSNNNEWIWIEVPKSIYITAVSSSDYANIEKDMQTYVSVYRRSAYTDTWYSLSQHGFVTAEDYNKYKNNMLKSVYENGGFYIGRYEVGTQTARFTVTDDTGLTNPIIKQDAYPYNFVTSKQAQKLSNQLATGGKTSSLMFGIQWDLVLKFIETKKGRIRNELNSDSTTWGNYKNTTFDIKKGKYLIDSGSNFTAITSTYTKPKDTNVLLTTGATSRNTTLNIYDLAGNVLEWTLEYTSDTNKPCCLRGGHYADDGEKYPVSARFNDNTTGTYCNVGFRTVLY